LHEETGRKKTVRRCGVEVEIDHADG